MIKALIVEDESLAAGRLQKLINEIDNTIEIVEVCDSIEGTVNWLKHNDQPDLIFLDIQLADGRSFEIFEHIKVQSPVIFTTAYDEYAIKAFEVNSIDYLLKPIKPDDLKESINKFKSIKAYFSENELSLKLANLLLNVRGEDKFYKNRFLVNSGDALIPVPSTEIAYFFAEDKVVFLVTFENKKHIINYSLDMLEEKLDPKLFKRANRQFILSAKSIKKIHNYFNYKLKIEVEPFTNKELIISRANVVEFKNWMNA